MTSRSSGQVSGIKRKSPTEGHQTLDFFMAGDGTSTEHKRVMMEMGSDYATAIRNSTLQNGDYSMAYDADYIPSLAYCTPAHGLCCAQIELVVIIPLDVRSSGPRLLFIKL
jgi:hypothetical protein